jgi:hypothetical protein
VTRLLATPPGVCTFVLVLPVSHVWTSGRERRLVFTLLHVRMCQHTSPCAHPVRDVRTAATVLTGPFFAPGNITLPSTYHVTHLHTKAPNENAHANAISNATKQINQKQNDSSDSLNYSGAGFALDSRRAAFELGTFTRTDDCSSLPGHCFASHSQSTRAPHSTRTSPRLPRRRVPFGVAPRSRPKRSLSQQCEEERTFVARILFHKKQPTRWAFWRASWSGSRQGLTLVHFSAQLEPCLTHKNTLHTINTL